MCNAAPSLWDDELSSAVRLQTLLPEEDVLVCGSVYKRLSCAVLAAMLVAELGVGACWAQDAAKFEITSVSRANEGEAVHLTFRSERDMIYRVEGSPALGAGAERWSNAGASAAGNGGALTLSVATAGLGDQYYFRITSEGTVAPPGFVFIPAGAFEMGDSFVEGLSHELPVHAVNVSAFFLQATETTKAEWDEVRNWAVETEYGLIVEGSGKGTDHPVHLVTWYDVVKWCNARSEKEGLTPCYYTDEERTEVYRSGNVDLTHGTVRWDADGYRLPTEAEWEKAARGGLQGRRFPWGDTISHSQANFWNAGGESYASGTSGYPPDWDEGFFPYTSPVGSFVPNGYGLFDMTGNVWEWCWDSWHGGYYADSPEEDPLGPDDGSFRVFRGGSWHNDAFRGRVANRGWSLPWGGSGNLGFRTARGQ